MLGNKMKPVTELVEGGFTSETVSMMTKVEATENIKYKNNI